MDFLMSHQSGVAPKLFIQIYPLNTKTYLLFKYPKPYLKLCVHAPFPPLNSFNDTIRAKLGLSKMY